MPAPLTTPQARRRVGARDVDAIRVVRTQLLDRQSSMRLAYVLAWVSLSVSVAAFTGGMAVSFLWHLYISTGLRARKCHGRSSIGSYCFGAFGLAHLLICSHFARSGPPLVWHLALLLLRC